MKLICFGPALNSQGIKGIVVKDAGGGVKVAFSFTFFADGADSANKYRFPQIECNADHTDQHRITSREICGTRICPRSASLKRLTDNSTTYNCGWSCTDRTKDRAGTSLPQRKSRQHKPKAANVRRQP
jgi:hypothetical protein